jgi:hypothetical protein
MAKDSTRSRAVRDAGRTEWTAEQGKVWKRDSRVRGGEATRWLERKALLGEATVARCSRFNIAGGVRGNN